MQILDFGSVERHPVDRILGSNSHTRQEAGLKKMEALGVNVILRDALGSKVLWREKGSMGRRRLENRSLR